MQKTTFPMQIRPDIAQAALMLLQRVQIKPAEIPIYQQVAQALNMVAQQGQGMPQGEQQTPEQAGAVRGVYDNTRVPEAETPPDAA